MEIHVTGDVDADVLAQELTDGLGVPVTVTVVDPRGEPRIFGGSVSDIETAIRIVESHLTAERRQFDQLVEKARRVWRGEDTFTVAQIQKIVAGLVLLENRQRTSVTE